MKFQSDYQILNHKGETISKSEEDDTPVTLGEVLTMACITANPQEYNTGEEKLKIYRILQKVSVEGEIEIEAEDIAMLKKLIGEVYGVVLVGAVYDFLEGKAESEGEDDDNKGKDSEGGA